MIKEWKLFPYALMYIYIVSSHFRKAKQRLLKRCLIYYLPILASNFLSRFYK